MSKNRNGSLFWISYADLMTSLFFVMLVLFVISVSRMQIVLAETNNALKDANVTIRQQQQILQLDNQFKILSASSELTYIEENKVFTSKELLGIDIFYPESDEIRNEHLATVLRVGHSLEGILEKLNQQNPDLSYLLIIEGFAAIPIQKLRSGEYNPDLQYAYDLSFRRALAVYNYWRRDSIDLRRYNTEVLVCGSGFNGRNRDTQNEDNNKRFVIQILPKVARTVTN